VGKPGAFAVALLLVSALGAKAAELRVFTVRAGATVLETIGPEFERTSGNKLEVVSGFGPALVKRINAGEQFDILISAPPAIDALIKNGKLIANTRANIMRTGMGVEVRKGAPKPDIGSVDAFKRALLNAKSIGYLKVVNRVEGLIDRLGLTDAIKAKVTATDSDIVSDLVAKGQIELGIVVYTQILTSPGVDLVGPLPPELQYFIQFTAGVSAASKAPDAGRELIKFLSSPTAIPVIKSQGMEPG
jgi:molybdate transport system substrate-binding protein